MTGDLQFIHKFGDKCCAEVNRGGQPQPCDKTAVAVTDSDDGWWPVCARHTRTGHMVALTDLLKALAEAP